MLQNAHAPMLWAHYTTIGHTCQKIFRERYDKVSRLVPAYSRSLQCRHDSQPLCASNAGNEALQHGENAVRELFAVKIAVKHQNGKTLAIIEAQMVRVFPFFAIRRQNAPSIKLFGSNYLGLRGIVVK